MTGESSGIRLRVTKWSSSTEPVKLVKSKRGSCWWKNMSKMYIIKHIQQNPEYKLRRDILGAFIWVGLYLEGILCWYLRIKPRKIYYYMNDTSM